MSILNTRKLIWFNGIQARMIFMLTFASILVFGLFALVYYQAARKKMDTEAGELSLFFANHLSISLAPALWNYDLNASDSILRATMKEKQVVAVYVRDPSGNLLFGRVRNGQWESISVEREVPIDDFVESRKEITKTNQKTGAGEKLGTVDVLLTMKFVREKLQHDLVTMLITFIVLDGLLFLILFFSIKRIIISPIRAVVGYLSRLAAGDIPDRLTELYWGEFNEIRKSLNMLIEATNQTTMAAEEIAVGNMAIKVKERSEHDRMMKALVRMIERLDEILKETDRMIRAVGSGRLDIRGDARGFEGGWKALVIGVNQLLDGLSAAIAEKAALNHEMALARRLQTSLLPTVSGDFHPDFEIAAAMLPAEQVGGDFYDITYDRAGNLWLAVGDVSGHGVTPGLIMMMAQTVHTTVTTNIDCEAGELVVMLNDILYKNVHERLRENHFMTFTALKYLGQGRFEHAGAHLSMIVVRRETGTCELIRTTGVYLNFMVDITRAIQNHQFSLEDGDILVLYTDGLTEAQNGNREMLDIGGLVKIVEKHCRQAPEVMKELIMAEVIRWCDNKRTDDMSIVIVKRKAAAAVAGR